MVTQDIGQFILSKLVQQSREHWHWPGCREPPPDVGPRGRGEHRADIGGYIQ